MVSEPIYKTLESRRLATPRTSAGSMKSMMSSGERRGVREGGQRFMAALFAI